MFELKSLPSFHNDPFSPILFESKSLNVSLEQLNIIREILDISSSDSKFAEKAYRAILLVLSGGTDVLVPEITNLSPSSITLPAGLINLIVNGNEFDSTCIIYINGNQVLTQFNSANELETPIDLTGVLLPTSYSVAVINSNSLISNIVNLTVTDVELVTKSKPDSHVRFESVKSTGSKK